ncbi:hypothetical protein L249_7552 [Ophiocordyceps polyrhachis-furcata BCC 54312]|uniref:Mannose-1-phosphate guanyltransferase n=1 Tax=Ophiocordyceps polyrhachis-furcata BCC 54312 TaxID=1330021 RepID=A0A367LBL9_9HYPO|nr:hypothetical protein L249_7552 [Ophiocordyceps polyrhachis-furcata BCC 54312]
MSQKAKSSSKGGKKPAKSGETKSEQLLQAVVLADSFQQRFRPFTLEKPRCLLPLANRPLLDYTLEFLAMNGVAEVFIYCGAHADQIEDYVSHSRWSTASRSNPFSLIQFVRVSDAGSVGDVLRDLDTRSLVDGDFILVHGDLVCNMMLDGALAAHRARREADAANIMTTILRSAGDDIGHRTKTNAITPVFVVDSDSKRILQYEETTPLQRSRYLALDPTVVNDLSSDFEVRSDLIDAHIDICTSEVLVHWSESFDWELPRAHFLHGILKDWELNGKMMYAEVLDEGYAARASDLQMYDAISRDVLACWTAPMIPQNNVAPEEGYQRRANGLVVESGVDIAPDACLSNTVVGRDVTVGPACTISNSVIGRGCRIGAGVVIQDSFIWHDVTIGDEARVKHSILADSVVVGRDCVIPAGCLVSTRVRISPGVALDATVVLSTTSPTGEPVFEDTALLGPETNAAVFDLQGGDGDEDDDDDDDDSIAGEDPSSLQKSLIYSLADVNLSTSSVSTLSSSTNASTTSLSSTANGTVAATMTATTTMTPETTMTSSSLPTSSAGVDIADDGSARQQQSFHDDAVHGLVDALRAEVATDFASAKLEFMGLRLSSNASDKMMRRAVATAFATRAAELLTPQHGSLEPSRAAERALTRHKGAAGFVADVGVAGRSVDFIFALQAALLRLSAETLKMGTLLSALLQQLYGLDVIDEDAILAWWYHDTAVDADHGLAALKERCSKLVEWLENASEEEDDDEEDD